MKIEISGNVATVSWGKAFEISGNVASVFWRKAFEISGNVVTVFWRKAFEISGNVASVFWRKAFEISGNVATVPWGKPLRQLRQKNRKKSAHPRRLSKRKSLVPDAPNCGPIGLIRAFSRTKNKTSVMTKGFEPNVHNTQASCPYNLAKCLQKDGYVLGECNLQAGLIAQVLHHLPSVSSACCKRYKKPPIKISHPKINAFNPISGLSSWSFSEPKRANSNRADGW